MTTIDITPDLLDAAGINRETWQRLCNLTGGNESARTYRGSWAIRRLRAVVNDDQEVPEQ